MDDTKKGSAIGIDDIRDLYDRFCGYHSVLNVLGVLISTSTLEGLYGEHLDNMNLRAGIQEIIALVVEKQESELDDLLKKAIDSSQCVSAAR